ncbi:putative Thioredoxin [Blattamonas nauphoetae]|uniref:Thioredoxin n=1 Tax=Blattamonas nauphoetae TaxID=2049346 RepID=A0ABQ9X627_9EUKA|nr:putative Thioredoxin [Blattamonas nauphoetae]
MSVIHIESPEQYKKTMDTDADKLHVVDFSATWCGPCQRIKPVYDALPSKFPNVVFLHCDVDKLRDLDEVDTVQGVPTFRFWKGGKKLAEFSGANESTLLSNIEKHQ